MDALERRFLPDAEGRRLAYFEAGSGPDLVLLHGALVNADEMRLGPMSALAEHYHVVAFDRPGHGLSQRCGVGDASMWRQAETLAAACERLKLAKPVVLGHSFGGAVALAWAAAFPERLAGVVAVAPICFPEARLEHALFGPRALPLTGDVVSATLRAVSDPLVLPTLWRAMFLPQVMPPAFADGFSFDLAGRWGQTAREGENAMMLFADLARAALAYRTCRSPVAFLCGNADMVVNNFAHDRIASEMIPTATFRWVHGFGHMLHHFRGAEVLEAIRVVERAATAAKGGEA